MRTPFICGNWKMYKTVAEALAFLAAAKDLVAGAKEVEIGIAAPATTLKSLADAARGTNIKIGGENCHWEKEGAFTGEISPAMLVEVGASFVLVGHSERRQYFGETNATVNKKTKAALAAGLQVIVCVGETLAEREAGQTRAVVVEQIQKGLEGLGAGDFAKLVVAYEPVWAIGTGKTATPAQAEEVHAVIRGEVANLFGKPVAEALRIQYGGSVKPENVKEIMAQPNVDGALVGGAALKPDSFAKLVNFRS
ncbi:MAG: triose-phosphate isomerase [Planctomycetota bacterium]|jgi:triosephosphate isomerase|nr:triose-phosphate isomerase [Planctomycetota bacterium]